MPEIDEGSGRWSLDHLFLDRQGVPILVEVKRASDTRLRREVVGQMLDYAANGVAYWPVEQLSSVFVAQPGNEVRANRLVDFLAGEDADEFWRQVESNLKAGRVRMVFVADRIPRELRRIVEFLNEQMRPAEVLAKEMEQFTGPGGLRVLAPRVLGATERAAGAKAVQSQEVPLSEEQWLNDLRMSKGEAVAKNALRLLDWFRAEGFIVGMTDKQDSMYARVFRPDGTTAGPFFVRRGTGRMETALQYLQEIPALESKDARLDLLNRINGLPCETFNKTYENGWPAIPLEALSDNAVWEGVTEIAPYVREQIGMIHPATPSS